MRPNAEDITESVEAARCWCNRTTATTTRSGGLNGMTIAGQA
jgi:hypothetical protein